MTEAARPLVTTRQDDSGITARIEGSAIGDSVYRWTITAFALCIPLLLVFIALEVGTAAWPALRTFGLSFLFTSEWDPPHNIFGAAPAIYGTIVSSIIALVIATPLALGVAIFLSEFAPNWLRQPVGFLVDLLAAIPSVVYGLWGIFVLQPMLRDHVMPFLSGLPLIGQTALFEGPAYGPSMLGAGLILAIMVLPFVTSISRDAFDAVPPVLKEAAYGLGCTTWEVVRYVVLPYARVGVIGGVMLGLGRALGETMAVTFVIGNAHKVSASLLAPGTTISATIANEFTEAVGDLYTSSLIALDLILFVITFIVLAIARYMLLRLQQRAR